MLALAIDTSLPIFSVALVRDEQTLGAYAAEGKGSRNEKLLVAIEGILAEAGIAMEGIDLLVATRGPGSFTGVRVGLATIQGLAFAIDRPICALSTHEAVLGGGEARRTLVVSEAGRAESYVSAFRGGKEEIEPRLVSAAQRQALEEEWGEVIVVEELLGRENVALLAARRARVLARGGELELRSDATPIYVRLAEAEVRLRGSEHG